MPIYEFKCRECDKVSEVLFRSTDGRAARCPDCGSENMEKLISGSHMIKMDAPAPGHTCCGRMERCEAPPCSTGDTCHKV